MNINELKKFISNYGSKDDYMREEAWHTFPIPKEVKNEYFNLFWKKRFSQWNKQLNFSNAKKVLFLRPTFGFVIDYLKKKNNSEYYFIEISDMSKREIIKKHNDVKELDGNITYILYGDFLKYKNYFDLIISHHTFVHVFNISHGIKKCKSLLKKNGKFIFTDEILFKPWNPFHYNYWTEEVFTKILKKHFSKVNVLNDAGFDKPTHIKNYTLKGDSPDFICIK